MDRVKIKEKAKEFGFNNKWNIWKPLLLIGAISFAISFVIGLVSGGNDESLLSLILSLVLEIAVLPLNVGLASYLLKLVRGKDVVLTEELLAFYKGEYLWKIIGVQIVAGLIIFAFSLLLIIPGIIYGIKFAMLSFVLAEQSSKEMQEEKAYKVSEKLMDGHKMEYFVFQLSFIGWEILCSFLIIPIIWFVPYYMTANAMWYDELKKISK